MTMQQRLYLSYGFLADLVLMLATIFLSRMVNADLAVNVMWLGFGLILIGTCFLSYYLNHHFDDIDTIFYLPLSILIWSLGTVIAIELFILQNPDYLRIFNSPVVL